MTSKLELSPKQQSIVDAAPGPIYVKASPGSGKTRVLTERIRHLLAQTNKKILALTFTNKAGQEIRDRLSDITDMESRTFIGTFHGFCQSILENHGKLIGYATLPHIFEEADRLELMEQAINQTPSYALFFKGKDTNRQKSLCYKALHFVSEIKRKLLSETDIENCKDDENHVLLYRSYQEILRTQNAIDFDDLLLSAYSLFIEYPKIAALYRRSFFAICVDEAQDLNNAQYQLLKALANGEFNNIMMVGDPNQSIYHFNGSSPDYMDKSFVADFSATTVALTENYRSSIAVLKAAKQIIPEAETIQGTVKQGIFELHPQENETVEAQWVAAKIQEIVTLKKHTDIEGEICPEKIAVLARNKYLFKPLAEIFQQSGIAYYYKMAPGSLKFESLLMQLFDLAFRVKLNPQDELHQKQLLTLLGLEDKKADLGTLLNQAKSGEHQKILSLVISLDEDGRNFKQTLEDYQKQASIDDDKQTLEDYQKQASIDDDNEKNMLFNDINELLTHWHNYAKTTDSKSLHQFKNAMALGQTHPLTQHTGVTLSTVHTMKGQEFDIVFVIGMDDETFPDYRAVRSGGVEMQQEKNNLYVAFTRSKRWLFVSWPEKRTMPWGDIKPRRISRFLKDF